MNKRLSRTQRVMTVTVMSLFGSLLVTACASDSPKGPPPPTPDQVRSHADRTFDKLKQEERERGAQPSMPR